ncbi:MAG: 8-amino-7-oxononanoate synthase [Burkholderiaceae bacterium]|jgi:8-amino-7-oxononanoate synthase|nr:8-amino-7-oxononanoate synthase [Burkholderiaceae bacterium]
MLFESIRQSLNHLADAHLLRERRVVQSPCGTQAVINGKTFLSFCSNDYLGLANNPALTEAVCRAVRQWGAGSGGSHVVGGHTGLHAQLEETLATFVGSERALCFNTGYMANLGIVPTLVRRGDTVFADRLNHASLIDATLLSRAANKRYRHGDTAHLAELLTQTKSGKKLILTDAVFSMDGDIADIPQLFALAERHDAWLVVDDAHGFGVLGKNGRGTLSHSGMPLHPRIIYMATLGKAAGVSGAFVAANALVTEWLRQRARTYIFTTADSPLVVAALLCNLQWLAQGDHLRTHLLSLAAQLHAGLSRTRWQTKMSPTAIQPVIIGSNEDVLRVSDALLGRGFFVPAIRPPTVPEGSARLRISLSAAHTAHQVDLLVNALEELQ